MTLAMTSTTGLHKLTHRVYDAINSQDLAALEDLFHPEVVRHTAGEVGIDAAKRATTAAFAAMPGLRFEVEDVIAEGTEAALRVTVHSDDNDPGKPLPTFLEIFRFEDNRVVEIWAAPMMSAPASFWGSGTTPA
jgi:predicted ester cyclase